MRAFCTLALAESSCAGSRQTVEEEEPVQNWKARREGQSHEERRQKLQTRDDSHERVHIAGHIAMGGEIGQRANQRSVLGFSIIEIQPDR